MGSKVNNKAGNRASKKEDNKVGKRQDKMGNKRDRLGNKVDKSRRANILYSKKTASPILWIHLMLKFLNKIENIWIYNIKKV